MRELIHCEDGGNPDSARLMDHALSRLLSSPTAAQQSAYFQQLGMGASLRFAQIPGSRVTVSDGMRGFHGPRGYTVWSGSHPIVVLNALFLVSDEAFRQSHLAPALAHELLGHGLGYGRAWSHGLVEAFHRHDLNEWSARVIGWIVDFELNAMAADHEAWQYLQAPDDFIDRMKLRHPTYAVTLGTSEMAEPADAFKRRIELARAHLLDMEQNLVRHRSWNRVIDHFISDHGRAAGEFSALKAELALTDHVIETEIAQINAAIAAMVSTLIDFYADTNVEQRLHLLNTARHPFFGTLEEEVKTHTGHLHAIAMKAKSSKRSVSADAVINPYWHGQVTFMDLVNMYESDRAHFPNAGRNGVRLSNPSIQGAA